MDSSDIPQPGQPVQMPPAMIQIAGESVSFHAHPMLPDGTLLEIRNTVASAAIALTTDGLRQIIEMCQLRLAQIKTGGLEIPEQGLFDTNGRKLT